MVEVGRLLAQRGVLVMTGGFGGVGMEAPARGAWEVGGKSVGYTWRGKPGNNYLSDAIDCSYINGCELPPELQYGVRLGRLLTADAFVVAADGDPGTMVELMAVINLGAKLWEPPKRFAILKPDSTQPGWDAGALGRLRQWNVFPDMLTSYILLTTSPAQAVDWVLAQRS